MFENLVQSLKDNGQFEPIVLNKDNSEIIKNCNLYYACIEAGIDPSFINFAGDYNETYNFVFADKNRAQKSASVRAAVALSSIEPTKKVMGFKTDEEAINYLSNKLDVGTRQIKELKRIRLDSQALFNRVLIGELKVYTAKEHLDILYFDINLFNQLNNEEITYSEATGILADRDRILYNIFDRLKNGFLNRTDLPFELTDHGYDVNNMPQKLISTKTINHTIAAENPKQQNLSVNPETRISNQDSDNRDSNDTDNLRKTDTDIEYTEEYVAAVDSDLSGNADSDFEDNSNLSDMVVNEHGTISRVDNDKNESIITGVTANQSKISPISEDYVLLHNDSLKKDNAGNPSVKDTAVKPDSEVYFNTIGNIKLLNDSQCVPMNLDRSTVLLEKALILLKVAASILKVLKKLKIIINGISISDIDDFLNTYEEEFLEKMARNDKIRKTKSFL
jgi:hypothetical protein